MLSFLKDLMTQKKGAQSEEIHENRIDEVLKVQIATCALFLEVANSDDEFTIAEREKILSIMMQTFNLDSKYVEELMKLSEEQVEESVSLWEFTEIINNHFSADEKFNVLKNLWKLIYVDKLLHHYEDYFIRKISMNMRLSHTDFIAAKIAAKKELNIK